MIPMAHASDGGGSIRRPACHTGVLGLRPQSKRWRPSHAIRPARRRRQSFPYPVRARQCADA
ncbi:hypothetical protein GPL21_27260 [Bradyrhizobium pachyrhizi]|uniref:Amidase domain-containing protein n=1 Tax=Bradyrhizobium pachyrhizi TaxID=280333 RepID=A0A844T2A6_9BRAD|nr:hypothetical protein [Bradyrhizobium pachyrhizi]